MSDATNGSISIDDLFEALGTSSTPAKSKTSSSKKSKSAKGGAAKSKSKAAASSSHSSSVATSQKKASSNSADDANVMDVMAALGIIPSSTARASAAKSEAHAKRNSEREEQIREQQIRSQQWRRELEEQQRRRQMQAEAEAEAQAQSEDAKEEPEVSQHRPEQVVRGFAEDQTRIAEPSFLNKRESAETVPYSAAQIEQMPVAPERVVEQPAALNEQPAMQDAGFASEEPAPTTEPIVADNNYDAQMAPAAQAQMQAADESPAQAVVEPDEQVTVPLDEDSHGESNAPTGVIQPISESQVAAAPLADAPVVEEPQSHALNQPTGTIKPLDIADEPAQAMQPVAEPSAAPSVIQPLSEASMAASPQLERSIVSSEPRPSAQPKKITVAPQKEKHGVNKGNVVGVLLIVIALICAALTVMLLTGTIDASTFSTMASNVGKQQEETSSSSASALASNNAEEAGVESHAVYQYVVRGTDGSTHKATETATFGADGLLQKSDIVIDVTDDTQAQGLLDQLKADFADSVVDSGIREGEVYLSINIDRDDLDIDSYTELLSSNMAEFRIVETGVNDPA